jgi:hypothetical protein
MKHRHLREPPSTHLVVIEPLPFGAKRKADLIKKHHLEGVKI